MPKIVPFCIKFLVIWTLIKDCYIVQGSNIKNGEKIHGQSFNEAFLATKPEKICPPGYNPKLITVFSVKRSFPNRKLKALKHFLTSLYSHMSEDPNSDNGAGYLVVSGVGFTSETQVNPTVHASSLLKGTQKNFSDVINTLDLSSTSIPSIRELMLTVSDHLSAGAEHGDISMGDHAIVVIIVNYNDDSMYEDEFINFILDDIKYLLPYLKVFLIVDSRYKEAFTWSSTELWNTLLSCPLDTPFKKCPGFYQIPFSPKHLNSEFAEKIASLACWSNLQSKSTSTISPTSLKTPGINDKKIASTNPNSKEVSSTLPTTNAKVSSNAATTKMGAKLGTLAEMDQISTNVGVIAETAVSDAPVSSLSSTAKPKSAPKESKTAAPTVKAKKTDKDSKSSSYSNAIYSINGIIATLTFIFVIYTGYGIIY